MGFVKACIKSVLRKTSDSMHENAENNIKQKTYKQTKKDIKEANKQGLYINGSKKYKENLQKNIEKNLETKSRRDKFIDDL